MFLEMFHTLCQPLLLQLACASPSSLESYFVPILDDTPNCIPCLRCILGSNLTCFTRLLRFCRSKARGCSPRTYQGSASLPSSLLPLSLTTHLASGCLIRRNTRHGRSFRTLQFLSCVLIDVVVIGGLWRNVADTSQLTCSIQSRLLLLPLHQLSCSCFCLLRHGCSRFKPNRIQPCGVLSFDQSSIHPCCGLLVDVP